MLEQVTELNSMIMASSYSRSADLAPLRPCGVPPACGLGSPPTTLKTRRFGLKTLWQCVTKILLSRCYLFISSAFVLAIESYQFWRFYRIIKWKGTGRFRTAKTRRSSYCTSTLLPEHCVCDFESGRTKRQPPHQVF